MKPHGSAQRAQRRELILAAVLDAVESGAIRLGEPWTTRVCDEIVEIIVRPDQVKP